MPLLTIVRGWGSENFGAPVVVVVVVLGPKWSAAGRVVYLSAVLLPGTSLSDR